MPREASVREVLLRNAWFRGLPAALKDGILAEGLVRRVSDQLVYAAGDPPNGFFALISGEIRVVQTTAAGRSALLMIASPGTWFGETAMIDGQARSSDALTIGQARVLQLSPAAFRRLTSGNTEYYGAFARLVCEQYRRALDYIVTTSNLPLPARIAQRLLGLAHAHGRAVKEGVVIDLRLSQETLADTVGVSRQSLNRALKALELKGVVSVGYGAVTVLDTKALEALARSQTLPEGLG
jgi:CRP/FNR family transcriptional regulator, cyclic AMP receptor protein